MTSTDDLQAVSDRLQVDPGTQLLASFSGMQSPLAELPPGALDNLLIVSTKSPSTVEGRLRDIGADPTRAGLIPLGAESYDYDGPLWCADALKPNDLTGISIAFTQALQHVVPGAGWVLVEDLNVLLMYASETRICRLLSHLSSRARDRNVTGVYGVAREAIDDATYSNLRQSLDAEVDLRGGGSV